MKLLQLGTAIRRASMGTGMAWHGMSWWFWLNGWFESHGKTIKLIKELTWKVKLWSGYMLHNLYWKIRRIDTKWVLWDDVLEDYSPRDAQLANEINRKGLKHTTWDVLEARTQVYSWKIVSLPWIPLGLCHLVYFIINVLAHNFLVECQTSETKLRARILYTVF